MKYINLAKHETETNLKCPKCNGMMMQGLFTFKCKDCHYETFAHNKETGELMFPKF